MSHPEWNAAPGTRTPPRSGLFLRWLAVSDVSPAKTIYRLAALGRPGHPIAGRHRFVRVVCSCRGDLELGALNDDDADTEHLPRRAGRARAFRPLWRALCRRDLDAA